MSETGRVGGRRGPKRHFVRGHRISSYAPGRQSRPRGRGLPQWDCRPTQETLCNTKTKGNFRGPTHLPHCGARATPAENRGRTKDLNSWPRSSNFHSCYGPEYAASSERLSGSALLLLLRNFISATLFICTITSR